MSDLLPDRPALLMTFQEAQDHATKTGIYIDNIPQYGMIERGVCRTMGCQEIRNHMDRNTGYCRKCKIERGFIAPKPLESIRRAQYVSGTVAPPKELVSVQPTDDFINMNFNFMFSMDQPALLVALKECWPSIPLPSRLAIMKAALTETNKTNKDDDSERSE